MKQCLIVIFIAGNTGKHRAILRPNHDHFSSRRSNSVSTHRRSHSTQRSRSKRRTQQRFYHSKTNLKGRKYLKNILPIASTLQPENGENWTMTRGIARRARYCLICLVVTAATPRAIRFDTLPYRGSKARMMVLLSAYRSITTFGAAALQAHPGTCLRTTGGATGFKASTRFPTSFVQN